MQRLIFEQWLLVADPVSYPLSWAGLWAKSWSPEDWTWTYAEGPNTGSDETTQRGAS